MNRRRLLQLGATLFAAPAIVRAESLMRACVVHHAPSERGFNRYLSIRDAQKIMNYSLSKQLDDARIQARESAEFFYGRNSQWTEHESGIITLKRPNYSQTRLWPESER